LDFQLSKGSVATCCRWVEIFAVHT